jgi:6,7-dimethyl-8-ribityllumazine synthase
VSFPPPNLDGSKIRIAIVVARFNEHITSRLLDGALEAAKKHNVEAHDVFYVPGSFELPVVAAKLARRGYDAIVCLGCIIRHETDHYLHIATQAAAGIQRVSIDTWRPCIFGVLTCDTEEQALERSGEERNEGRNAVVSAIEMVNVMRGQ